jgi:two-component system, NtrC family, sensor histidine kinase HydH
MRYQLMTKLVILGMAISVISFLHYHTRTQHMLIHLLLQRSYYIPILVAALWFGWRGGILAAVAVAIVYAPYVFEVWSKNAAYAQAAYSEIIMFPVIGTLTGVLADIEKRERKKVAHTAQQLAEANVQLQASFEQLRRADRLSALGELSAGIAHEVRNPLGSIEGAIQILSRPSLPDETRKEFTELAQTELDRLKAVVTNFLEFARPQRLQQRTTQPSAIIESVIRLASETAKMAGVLIHGDLPDDVPSVMLDPEQIKQVLLNLVINAIQATPSGGNVTLRAKMDGSKLALEVEDEGQGIPQENLEKIFDPFFTTRADGTGLGLSIAHSIVSQHGGTIEVTRSHFKTLYKGLDLR